MLASGEEWKVTPYVDASGRSPVYDFIRSLDHKTQSRFWWSIEQLRVRNRLAREPLVKHLTGAIWELRRESNTNTYRILYTILPGNEFLLLHGFQKQSQKTPRREIDIALRRLAEFESRLEEEGNE
jgi:phage-related protein